MNRQQRDALAQIEQQLIIEDPALAGRLRGDVRPRSVHWRRVVAGAVGLLIVSIVVGYGMGVLQGILLTAIGVWRLSVARQRRRDAFRG